MQNVSREYKESMRGMQRNRGYIKATIGVVNSQAQESAEIKKDLNSLLYFSDISAPFTGAQVEKIYAMPEENFSRLDGTMYFAPDEDSGMPYYNNGAVSDDILGSITISFEKEKSYDIKGLTIDFSDYYPVDFTIENDNRILSYTGNNKRNWTTEDSFDNTTFIRVTPTKMINSQGRLRIYRFSCGVTNTFTNDDIMDYSHTEYVSPISETLPTNDVSLTVKNYDLYYLPDNPESTLAYMEQGQEVKIAFGYDTTGNGDIEWLPEKTSYLKTWKANETQAVFTATDIFDYMTGTYYRGRYRPEGISLYDLTVDVFEDAGIENYFIDSYLKDIIVKNPMPVVSHSEALQIIANAGRCAISEDRKGRIHIQSSFIPKMTATANNQSEYSHVENILFNDAKDGYANASNDFSVLDGNLRFLPDDGVYLNTGYISESLWVETKEEVVTQRLSFRLGNSLKAFNLGGYWDGDIPVITIDLEAVYTAFGLGITFRNIAPQKFVIMTYRDDALVDYVTVINPEINYYNPDAFVEFDKMEILFSMGYPGARIFVDNIMIGDATDYDLKRNQLHPTPMAVRQNKVKDIAVIYNDYKETTETVDLASEEITVTKDGEEYTAYFNKASYGLMLFFSCDDDNVTAEIVESSNYFAKIKFSGVTTQCVVGYSISGYEYSINEQQYIVNYNDDGGVKTWNNPLISTPEHAADVERWLGEYFLGDVEYEIDWRGDPAVDANDLFHLETKIGMAYIRGYENSMSFNGGWSGSMKARKVAR